MSASCPTAAGEGKIEMRYKSSKNRILKIPVMIDRIISPRSTADRANFGNGLCYFYRFDYNRHQYFFTTVN